MLCVSILIWFLYHSCDESVFGLLLYISQGNMQCSIETVSTILLNHIRHLKRENISRNGPRMSSPEYIFLKKKIFITCVH